MADVSFIQELGSLLFESMRSTNALGRSFIVEKDRAYSVARRANPAKFYVGKHLSSVGGLQWFLGQDDLVRISFNLIPREVIESLRKKAYWIAAVENQEVVNVLRREFEALQKVLEEGKSYEEFVRILKKSLEAKLPSRLDVVFRTNLFAAYTEGQLEQVAGMEDRFPYWRYLTILDSRTRPSHRELNDKVFRTDGPMQKPPIDFNCRCTPQFIHVFEAERLGDNLRVVDDPGGLLRSISSRFGEVVVKRFDEAEFLNWLRKQSLDPAIKTSVESLIK